MHIPEIGLLPLYVELYDETAPHLRDRINEFAETIKSEIEKRGINVICSDVCRVKHEFDEAVKHFEENNADAIVTLHLAYSPSLESCEALISTDLPLILLNTTPTYIFDNNTPVEEIMYNHGIHGVQDLCSVLKRYKRKYFIETGHWENSDVINRIASWAKAARLAGKMKSSRVGIVGMPFKGMGDFAIPFHELKKTIGIETVEFDSDKAKAFMDSITDQEIDAEIELDKNRFDTSKISYEAHYRSVRVGLVIRKWLAALWLTGRMLLGSIKDMDDIIEAMDKVGRNIEEI